MEAEYDEDKEEEGFDLGGPRLSQQIHIDLDETAKSGIDSTVLMSLSDF